MTTTAPQPSATARYLPPIALPAVAAVCSAAASTTHETAQLLWAVAAVATTAATAALPVLRERRAAASGVDTAQARLRLAATLSRAAEPLVNALNAVTSAPDPGTRRTALEVLTSLIVDHAHSVCWQPQPPAADIRATFYELDGDRLIRRRTAGRADIPRLDFHRDRSLHDHEAVRLAHGEHPLIVTDLHTNPPAHFEDSKGRTYRSFIATPVRGGATSYGLLILDADQPCVFNGVDKHQLLLMAAILGAGHAHLAAIPDISPCPLHLTATCEQTQTRFAVPAH